MGMDIYGLRPKTSKGTYFRNNVWYWHPLWDYCCTVSPDITNKVKDGHSNSGDGLNAVDSRMLGFALKESINSGQAQKYVDSWNAHVLTLPKESCYCTEEKLKNSTEIITSILENGFDITPLLISSKKESQKLDPNPECRSCSGTGLVPNMLLSYHIDMGNITAFSEFLIDCGGFQIW